MTPPEAAPRPAAPSGRAGGPPAGDAPHTADAPVRVDELATAEDLAVVAAQLGRPPRGTRAVAHRCPCGLPDVVATRPRLADGTPFPTLYYLTCPRAVAACGRLESSGLMREMTDRLADDAELARAYQAAHERYLTEREAIEAVPEIAGVSAGGMPTRVKCLHVHLGYALAAGPGVDPFGDEVRELVGDWWSAGRCVEPPTGADRAVGSDPAVRSDAAPAPAQIGPDARPPSCGGAGDADG